MACWRHKNFHLGEKTENNRNYFSLPGGERIGNGLTFELAGGGSVECVGGGYLEGIFLAWICGDGVYPIGGADLVCLAGGDGFSISRDYFDGYFFYFEFFFGGGEDNALFALCGGGFCGFRFNADAEHEFCNDEVVCAMFLEFDGELAVVFAFDGISQDGFCIAGCFGKFANGKFLEGAVFFTFGRLAGDHGFIFAFLERHAVHRAAEVF
jgi:hypothetical protein